MKADIARERVILEHALDVGHPLEVAESMLHALEAALRIFEKHRELVLDQLKRWDHPSAPPAAKQNDGPGLAQHKAERVMTN